MTKFYFLQEGIIGVPYLLFACFLSITALLTELIIIIKTSLRIDEAYKKYKSSQVKQDGTFIIFNFIIATILIIGGAIVLYKLSGITFD